jgi:predicted O-methyltransferase YrrM
MMDRYEADQIVGHLYKYLLQREPGAEERDLWTGLIEQGVPITRILDEFGASAEYRQRHAVVPFFAPGHYYSPVVHPDEDVRRYMIAQQKRVGVAPEGIEIGAARMRRFFGSNAAFMASATFTEDQIPRHRYYAQNGGFPLGDALVLRSMIANFRPRRIIEVGSGFSTACILDTLDEIGHSLQLTCIEPHPDRLKSLLRPTDILEIIESPVQNVPLDRFQELESNDILFIDSTHVVKSGSDVHYELFEVLPSLRPGVLIHFHDVMYPFEYPLEWVFDQNYSWNETYFVRAFLMHNRSYSVFYSSSYMAQQEPDMIKEHFPTFPANPGTGLWLIKEGLSRSLSFIHT